MAHLHYLVDETSTITSITTGVDYNDDDDHEDDDTMPSLLVFTLNSLYGHLQTQSPSLALMKRRRQGVAEMLQYPLLVSSMYVLL